MFTGKLSFFKIGTSTIMKGYFINLARLSYNFCIAGKLGHGHPRPLGQHRHRVFEGQVLQLHHIVDRAAPLAAAEALVHLPVGHHVEGGSLFTVKGAQAKEVGAAALIQVNIGGDNVRYVASLLKLL